jgi:hypothetical protein
VAFTIVTWSRPSIEVKLPATGSFATPVPPGPTGSFFPPHPVPVGEVFEWRGATCLCVGPATYLHLKLNSPASVAEDESIVLRAEFKVERIDTDLSDARPQPRAVDVLGVMNLPVADVSPVQPQSRSVPDRRMTEPTAPPPLASGATPSGVTYWGGPGLDSISWAIRPTSAASGLLRGYVGITARAQQEPKGSTTTPELVRVIDLPFELQVHSRGQKWVETAAAGIGAFLVGAITLWLRFRQAKAAESTASTQGTNRQDAKRGELRALHGICSAWKETIEPGLGRPTHLMGKNTKRLGLPPLFQRDEDNPVTQILLELRQAKIEAAKVDRDLKSEFDAFERDLRDVVSQRPGGSIYVAGQTDGPIERARPKLDSAVARLDSIMKSLLLRENDL